MSGRIKRLNVGDYQGRVWATRKRPWIDRLACIWFIRRFIDAGAKIKWLDKPADCPKRALGFDFDGATFSHLDGRVTFEVLVATFGFESDVALEKIGAAVHYLDIGGIPAPEASGLEIIIRGARQRYADDDDFALNVAQALDLFYAGYDK